MYNLQQNADPGTSPDPEFSRPIYSIARKICNPVSGWGYKKELNGKVEKKGK
jgi:hypothetical protein